MTQKKYELLKNDTITAPNGKTLYRIKALIESQASLMQRLEVRFHSIF